MYGPVVLAALCLLVHVDYALAYPKSLFGSSSLHLNILHTNDIHSRILESDQWGGECGERRRDRSKCFGGVARIAQKVREIKSSRRNTLFLNAGGFFQGTLWYSTLKHKIATYAMSRMGYDVIGLGNNEFDDGPKELAPFVREMRKSGVAVVGTNVDVSREPHFKGVPLSRSHVITISGVRVALLAVVPKETEIFSRPGHVRILPLAESINKEVWRLRQQGVKIFILISQAGFEADKRLAVACPELDVIVGGHSETFLYSGPPPLQEDARRVRGPYPFLVSRKGRRSCVIVQGYRYGKYLGNLEVLFNRKGEITHWRGRPILLDQSIGQDPNILRGLMPFKRTVEDALKKVVGSTKVVLEASNKVCRSRECNLGNLITDSFFDFYANRKSKVPHAWSDVNAAIINGGTVRESIRQSSKVTLHDLQRAMPIDNELVVMNMNGSQLRGMFEHAVSNSTLGQTFRGKFLQVSGIRVNYDLGRPSGWRVARLRILCTNCSVPRYEDVDFNKRYTIVTTSFIANGGDGFKFDKGVLKRSEGLSAFFVFTKYFTKLSPIKTAEEGRITVKNLPPRGKPTSPLSPQIPAFVPGQAPVPGSATTQPPVPGLAPVQPPMPGPAPNQLGPVQAPSTGLGQGQSDQGTPSNIAPGTSQFGPVQAPGTALGQGPFNQGPASNTGTTTSQLGPVQAPSAGLGPSSPFGQGQTLGPAQATNIGIGPSSSFNQGQSSGTAPAATQLGPVQATSTGLSPSSPFGQAQASGAPASPSPLGPAEATNTGFGPSSPFNQGQASGTVAAPGQLGPGLSPSAGFGQSQFGQVTASNSGPGTNQLGSVQAPSTVLGQGQFGPGQPPSPGPAPNQLGPAQATNPGLGSLSPFGQGQASGPVPPSGQLGQAQGTGAVLGPSTPFGQGQALGAGPAPSQLGPAQASSTGLGSLSPFGQGTSTGPAPNQLGPAQATNAGLGSPTPFGQAQASGTVPPPGQLGQAQATGTGLGPSIPFGQAQPSGTWPAQGQFGPGPVQNTVPAQSQLPPTAFGQSPPPSTGLGAVQSPTTAAGPSQTPTPSFPTDSNPPGGWSSA